MSDSSSSGSVSGTRDTPKYSELMKMRAEGDTCSAWVDDAILAWAQQHSATGSKAADEELMQLCHLCKKSPVQLQALVKQRLGFCLVKHPEDATAWEVVHNVEDKAQSSPAKVSELGRLVATFPQFLSWQEEAVNSGSVHTLSTEQHEVVVKMARIAFANAPEVTRVDTGSTDDLLDPMMAVAAFQLATGHPAETSAQIESVRSAWATEVKRQRQQAAHRANPGRRSARATPSRVPGFYNTRINDDEFKESPTKKEPTRSRRSLYSSASEDSELPTTKRIKKSVESMQIDLMTSNEIVYVRSANNHPDASHFVRIRDFVPLVFPDTADEPSHVIVEPRVIKHLGKNRRQVQSIHEYAIDGFPSPVDPGRWLAQQRLKYEKWLLQTVGCTSVMMENQILKGRCLTTEPYGAAMCRSCINRQTDDHCGFKNVRMVTKLHVVLNNGEEFVRYLLVPMFESVSHKNMSKLIVAPLAIPAPLAENGDEHNDVDLYSSSNDGYDRKPAGWSTFYNMFMTAGTLQPTLDMLSKVLGPSDEIPTYVGDGALYGVHPQLGCSAAPCIYRPLTLGSRQFCDICRTSILSTYYSCAMCTQEVCPRCFAEWDDSCTDTRVIDPNTQEYEGPRRYNINSCKRMLRAGKYQFSANHKRQQFIRVSQFVRNDVERMREKLKQVLSFEHMSPNIDCGGILCEEDLRHFHTKRAQIHQRTRRTYAHEPWELPVIYVDPDELTTEEFSRLWRGGEVVVVRGLLPLLDSTLWKPDWWIKKFGFEMVNVLDCNRDAEPVGEWPLRDFYRLFDGEDSYAHMFDESMEEVSGWRNNKQRVKNSILKLKDWPPAEDFQTRLPDHFARFMDALPFPEYTQRAGAFNLANQLPPEFLPPDLGPKMYCAYGSSDGEGGVGTTNLHCDMADAVNIMAYAAPQYLRAHGIEVPGLWTRKDDGSDMTAVDSQVDKSPTGAAVWDIYTPEAVANLREYIRETQYSGDTTGDPIHDQGTFLTYPMRKEIYERYGSAGGSCYRIYQNPGDAVFVPAGCAHQVCNYASAVKIAMDFVSPERVEHCRRLTSEFRQLKNSHPRNHDLLQLNSIMWWTFAGRQDLQTKSKKNSS
ncbi:hypothetical protein IW142_001571 [Coemansia sp. RSA 564]|nr:hypothetical protein IW142_001571 [Coemansia sp. RSA 564]